LAEEGCSGVLKSGLLIVRIGGEDGPSREKERVRRETYFLPPSFENGRIGEKFPNEREVRGKLTPKKERHGLQES